MIIPMFFTCARIFIAPFLFQAICNHTWLEACILCCIGAATDFLDGFSARYLHQESSLGAALDPVADKIFLITALYALSLQVSYIPFFIVIFIAAKEMLLMLAAAILLYKIPGFTIQPLWSAKVLTACSCIAFLVMIGAQLQVFFISETVLSWIIYAFLVANLYILVEYGFKIYAQLKDYHAR